MLFMLRLKPHVLIITATPLLLNYMESHRAVHSRDQGPEDLGL